MTPSTTGCLHQVTGLVDFLAIRFFATRLPWNARQEDIVPQK